MKLYTKENLTFWAVSDEKLDDSWIDVIIENNNVVSPLGLANQIAKEQLTQKISEAKAYLANTDYKMLPNYVPKANEDLDAIIVKRNEAREFIRNNNA